MAEDLLGPLAKGLVRSTVQAMTPLNFFALGAGLGLSAAGTPGPLTAVLISETLRRGWRRGLLVSLAPLVSDAPIVLVTTFLLGQLPVSFLRLISVAGGLFVLWIARRLWTAWREGLEVPAFGSNEANIGLRQAIIINYLSPGPYLFWALVNGPLLLSAWEQSLAHAVFFLVGFYGLFLGAMGVLVAVFQQARRLGPRLVRGLTLASIAMLLVFSGLLLWRGLFGP